MGLVENDTEHICSQAANSLLTCWRVDDGPKSVVFGSIHQLKKSKLDLSKCSGSAHGFSGKRY